MVRLTKLLSIFFGLIILLSIPSLSRGQNYRIDITDGKIDSYWDSVGPIQIDAYGLGSVTGEKDLYGDIVNAWLVFDGEDPNILYFRVDGYEILSDVYVYFSCDGNLEFNGINDRSIYFFKSSEGVVSGEINYTEAYIDDNPGGETDLLATESAVGEYVEVIDENLENDYYQIEAYLELTDRDRIDGPMSTCFKRQGNGNWNLSYFYRTEDDQTGLISQQIRTAVTLKEQSAEQSETPLQFAGIGIILIAMTFSLLFLRRYLTNFDL